MTYFEYKHVLGNGFREAEKNKYDEKHKEWTYAMKGNTLDGRRLRVIVSFDVKLNLITVIDLEVDS